MYLHGFDIFLFIFVKIEYLNGYTYLCPIFHTYLHMLVIYVVIMLLLIFCNESIVCGVQYDFYCWYLYDFYCWYLYG